MTSINEKSNRANIRIEIKNDITESEAMDIDTTAEIPANDAEIEDGEISDCTEEHTQQQKNHRTIILNKQQNESQNIDGMTDAPDDEFFGVDAQEKRAKRFGLDAEMLSDQQVLDLLDSLGITDEEKPNTRFEALHMYGTQEMSTQDIYAYFGKFTPNSVEWINDESCNVVWLDKATAARALNHLSKIIAGMPVRGHHTDPTTIGKKNGTSILLMDDTSKRAVNVSDLNIPIPPGYWRLGDPCPKAKHLLLRYAKRTDKKPFRAEKFSNKKPFGVRGITSESKRTAVKGNPWGRLAQDWNKDVLERPQEETPAVPFKPKTSKALLNRLGTTKKRSFSPPTPVSDDNDDDEKEPVKKSKVPRMRMYADEEEARVTKMKELKKIRALEQIEERVDNHVPDLRNRLTSDRRKPLITSRLQLRPTYAAPSASVKQEIKVTARNDFRKEPSDLESESESEDEELNVQQRSKVTVIVKKQSKPTVASTIWSRLAADDKIDKSKQSSRRSNSNSSSSNSSNSDTNKSESESESDAVVNSNKNDFAKTLNNPRPGFRKDLKSRLGLNNSEHKSPLRIEINNDHYDNK